MPLTYAWWKCLLNEREELETLDDAGILVSQPLGLRFMGGGGGQLCRMERRWTRAARPRDGWSNTGPCRTICGRNA